MDKDTLRREMRALRKGLSLSGAAQTRLVELFFAHIPLSSGMVIAGYWPMGGECDARVILHEAQRRGYSCALPVIEAGQRVLSFALYQDGDALVEGALSIAEPVSKDMIVPDIVIVPLLAFDAAGQRLGQGGGYYDATLAHLRALKPICAVGLAYAQQECKDAPLVVEAHDQPLDWIITPQQAKQF